VDGDDVMEDKQLGISIRFIREFDVHADRQPTLANIHDAAFALALYPFLVDDIDEDDVRTFRERLADAYAYLRERQRHIH
jgi:protein tyrosine phosphatase (PTP) superfamily phosphohydrolase (DUF442 family)